MRDYGTVSPRFWIGETGKDLRGHPEAQVLALYLMTSPHANMIGVFHCPLMYMAHETGLPIEGATKALARLSEIGFCMYDQASETVFVTRMAAHQVGENLKSADNKVLGIRKEWEKIAVPVFKKAYFERYKHHHHLSPSEGASKGLLEGATEAPPKQLTGTEQEQEQKKGRDAPFELPAWIPEEHWSAFVEVRKKVKAANTPHALRCVVAELERLRDAGNDVVAVLDKSTRNSWKDVYPIKGQQQGPGEDWRKDLKMVPQ